MEIIEQVDTLAVYRQQVAAENSLKPVMSEKAKAKLRNLTEHDKTEKAANAKFAAWFAQQDITVEFLTDLMFRSSPYVTDIRKRAIECAHMFQKWGHTPILEPHTVMFLGEMLPEEESLTVAKIESLYPVDLDKPIYVPSTERIKPARLCALGRKCLRAKKNRAAECSGEAQYCSINCRGRAKIRARAPQNASSQPN